MKSITLVLISIIITGCSHSPLVTQDIANEPTLEIVVPGWYFKPEGDDELRYFSAGTAFSKDISHAYHQARLEADYSMAKRMAQRLTGSESKLVRENNPTGTTGGFLSESQEIVESWVSEYFVGHGVVADYKLLQSDEGFRVFLLIKYESNSANNANLTNLTEGLLELRNRVRDDKNYLLTLYAAEQELVNSQEPEL